MKLYYIFICRIFFIFLNYIKYAYIKSDIWNIPNLIISPHISADDGNSYIKNTLILFLKNLEFFMSNKPLINQVDRNLGY